MFKDSGVPIGAGDLNGSGQASFSTSSLAVGSRSLTAEYLGDDNFNGSSSASLAHQVDKANSATTLIASSSSSTLGQTVIFTATVTAVSPGSGTPGGIVIFKDGGVPLATVFLSGSGRAVFSTNSLEAGSHSIVAQYEGDASFNDSLSSPVVVDVLTQADVSIEKTSGPGTVYAGEQIQYQVLVTNNGPAEAQDVSVLDVLPDEVTYQIDSSGSCTQPVELTGLRAVLDGANEVPPVSTPASGLATFVLDMTTNQLTYAIQVSQIGTITAAHIHTGAAGVNGPVYVPLYSGTPLFDPTHPVVGRVVLTPAQAASILANPDGYYVNVHTSAFPGGEIRGQLTSSLNTPLRCELGAIQFDQSRHFDVYATAFPEATPDITITNVAIVSSDSDLGDPALWNNVSRADNLLLGKADLKVTKYGKPDHEVRAGELLTYTIFVDNLGPGIAHTVVLTDVLESSGSFNLLLVDSDRPAVCAPASGTFTGSMQIRCDLTDPLEVMTPTYSGRWKLIVVVTAEESQSINNTVIVVGADLDPNLSNNQAIVEHDITDVADLNITKTAVGEVQQDGQPGSTVILMPDRVTAGQILTYTLVVTNQGPSTAENVVAQDRLPAWVEIQSIIPSQGSCNWGTPGDPWDKMTCGLGTLAPSTSATIVIRMQIPSWVSNESILRNDALVYSDVFDPNNADNFAFNQVTVDAWADLSVSKLQWPEIVLPYGAITYTITVSNTGPSDAPGALVVNLAPSELISVTWSCTASSQAACTASGVGDIDEAVILPSGETVTYTLLGTVTSYFPFTNTVTVAAPLGIPDPYLLNNQSSTTNKPYILFYSVYANTIQQSIAQTLRVLETLRVFAIHRDIRPLDHKGPLGLPLVSDYPSGQLHRCQHRSERPTLQQRNTSTHSGR